MNILKFIKEYQRMNKYYSWCGENPLSINDSPEKILSEVKKWSKLHPQNLKLSKNLKKDIKEKIDERYYWVVRNKDNDTLYFFHTRPYLNTSTNIFYTSEQHKYIAIHSSNKMYNFVKFENSPVSLMELLYSGDVL